MAMGMIVIGFAILLLGLLLGPRRQGEKRVQGGAVVMIGPLPIVFGSDRRWALAMMLIALLIVLVWMITAVA
ncbi:MAG: DUF131 domain-containing protein [Nitrososphaerota archaeon]|nr:DUF131 domain-containing protein [Nitrososphaerota archaeon]